MPHLFRATCLSLPFLALPALADTSVAGAEGLKAVLQTYLGAAQDALSVAVGDGGYDVTVDLAALMPQGGPNKAQVSVTPLKFSLTDNGDGTWAYAQDQALSFAVVIPDALDMTVQVASVVSSGTFDEALMSFTQTTSTLAGLTMTQVQSDPTFGNMQVDYAIDRMEYASNAVAGAAGGVDTSMRYSMSGLRETVTLPSTDGSPPMAFTVDVESGTAEGSMTGLRPMAVYALIAWVVAHPDQAAMAADRAGVKAILRDGVPFFDHLDASALYRDASVITPFGTVGMAEIGGEIEARGVVADGMFREALRLKGLTLPEGLVPPFAADLMPEEFSIDFAVEKYDLAAAMTLGLTLLDLPMGASPPEGFDAQMLAALMPEGAVQITLAPGTLRNATYALGFEGQMTAGMAGVPTGTAKVSLAGVGAIMAALEQAPDEIKSQVLPVLGVAQAMAQPGPSGELVWQIDASQPGSLKINGAEMMGAGQ